MYDIDYFIEKFEKVPEYKFGDRINEGCALAQCGVVMEDEGYTETEESANLIRIFSGLDNASTEFVTDVNDGIGIWRDTGKTPKERILNRLYELKSQNV